jgi:hypothetical protein
MAQIDTRHVEKEKLISLLIAQVSPESIPMQITQTMAKMEQTDIDDVMRIFEKYKESIGK